MALGRPHILMPHHLAGHSHGHPAVDHRLNKEAAELFGLDGPADGRYAGLLEGEPEPPPTCLNAALLGILVESKRL